MNFVNKTSLKGTLKANSSKSHAIRLLVLASLKSNVTINNVSFSNDVVDTINALKDMGYNVLLNDNSVHISGTATNNKVSGIESATLFRILSITMGLFFDEYSITVKNTLALRELFLINEYKRIEDTYYIKKHSDTSVLDIEKTSQIASALLIYYSYLNKERTFDIKGSASLDYLLLTVYSLNDFGYNLGYQNNQIIINKTNETNKAEYYVEDDLSSVCFLIALAVTNQEVTVSFRNSDTQADRRILDFIKTLGVKYSINENLFKVSKFKYSDAVLDMENNIDMVPSLISIIVFSNKIVTLKNISNLKYKESDRLAAICNVLDILEVEYILDEKDITIIGTINNRENLEFDCLNDHRITMMCIVILTKLSGKLNSLKSIDKSFKEFLRYYESLGGQISDN